VDRPFRVVVVAGEASGDQHGAKVLAELKRLAPNLTASGIGGPALAAAGMDLLYRSEDLALVGISEVLGKLRQIWDALSGLKRHLQATRPDLVILVDFPDFNFRVAKHARKLGLKVLYYISPQVWAWRQKRAHKLAALVDHLAVVFPFEAEFYARETPSLPVTLVGHPLLDEMSEWEEAEPQPLPVPQDATLVGLLPGSRISEISRLLPLMMQAANIMRARQPGLHFVLPRAPGLSMSDLDPFLANSVPGLTVLAGRAWQVMRAARVILVASGTATLQGALAGSPMVVVYKTGAFNYAVAKRLIKVEHIAMPNLIAGRGVLPELIQGQATPQALAEQGLRLLNDEQARGDMLSGLAQVRTRLGSPGASQRVAELALSLMEGTAQA
jgi:lipid-A-disaccharide synthase